jgi:hypothetical protein
MSQAKSKDYDWYASWESFTTSCQKYQQTFTCDDKAILAPEICGGTNMIRLTP